MFNLFRWKYVSGRLEGLGLLITLLLFFFSSFISISSNPWSSALPGDILGSSTCSSWPVADTGVRMQGHFTVGFSSLANLLCRHCNLFWYLRVSSIQNFWSYWLSHTQIAAVFLKGVLGSRDRGELMVAFFIEVAFCDTMKFEFKIDEVYFLRYGILL